jgi:Ca-activated chloride channel family protein
MGKREMNGRALLVTAALALGVAWGTATLAQTAPRQPGDSASLASGVPITAPVTVDAGQSVNVVVEGAQPGARIQLWGPVGEPVAGQQIAAVPLTGGVAALTAPESSGSYELRYLDASGRQLGRRAFDVAAVPVALTVPTPVGRGGEMEITWQGPARPGDRFDIVGPSGAVVGSTPVAGDPAGVNRSRITAPAESGDYELRYVAGNGAVLRWVGFQVR